MHLLRRAGLGRRRSGQRTHTGRGGKQGSRLARSDGSARLHELQLCDDVCRCAHRLAFYRSALEISACFPVARSSCFIVRGITHVTKHSTNIAACSRWCVESEKLIVALPRLATLNGRCMNRPELASPVGNRLSLRLACSLSFPKALSR